MMWADILTKPLQGKAFRIQRAKLMNCAEDYSEPVEAPTEKEVSWQEPVGSGMGKTAGDKAASKSWPRAMSGRRPSAGLTQTSQECVGRSSRRSSRGVTRDGRGVTRSSLGLARDSRWREGPPRWRDSTTAAQAERGKE